MSAGGSYSKGSGRSQTNLTPQQYIDMYTQSLPGIMSAISGQVAPTATAQADAAAGILDKYGNKFQQAGQEMEVAQAEHTNRLLSGPGAQAARTATALNNELNPAQAAANQGAASLLSSFNMNGLSPGEQNAVERSTNQMNSATGNAGLINPTTTVANAMNFGREFHNKQERFGNALNTATNVAGSQNQQVNPLAVASGVGNTANNFGLSQFNPGGNTDTAFQLGQGWGSNLGGIASAGKSKNSNVGVSAQGGCCFIMLEAYHGNMPLHVRKCRDRYYRAIPSVATGYCRTARWLVPAMQKSDLIRELVWRFMVSPLTEYGKFVTRQDSTAKRFKIARKFWFSVWNFMGKL